MSHKPVVDTATETLEEKLIKAQREGRYPKESPGTGSYEHVYPHGIARVTVAGRPWRHTKLLDPSILAEPFEPTTVWYGGGHAEPQHFPKGGPSYLVRPIVSGSAPPAVESEPEIEMAGDSTVSREEIDAKIDAMTSRVEASEARVSTSIETLRGDISAQLATLVANVGHVREDQKRAVTLGQVVITVVSTTIALAALMIGVLTFGGDRFSGGISAASVSAMQSAETKLQSDENAAALETLTKLAITQQQQMQRQADQLDSVLERLPAN